MTLMEIVDAVDSVTSPAVMTKQKALDFLEELDTEIQGRMAALRDIIQTERDRCVEQS